MAVVSISVTNSVTTHILGDLKKLRNTHTIPFNVSYTAKFKPMYGAIP